ncbi:hypothetical protein [Pedobacter heparinus]|uniref:Uncharacterized protein n=1 Tax=Pedobacter heparinus (strain ATCC 13125 / DSM 2366 / CIP 104194 / JCM 7457 / NBRC 12017 / NCIMB 9290 / NRRL B-14731 / HIM 762-3) TaxID=485917 RepID=C6XUC5_PEDHD|nr:hypothetical protein [Pedobacter heparinus]ACU05918.1 hypothetical protein Phep_3727 [Pedobacter heparinus DSM 2366]
MIGTSRHTITYYKLPLGSIPFKEIKSLENLDLKFIYCSSFPLIDFMNLNFQMVSVYDPFYNDVADVHELNEANLLFGKVVSDKLSMRGTAKCIKVGSIEKDISKEDLPHLKYSNNNDPETGNWFYMKEGKYVIFHGIRSEFEKVKHLEGIAIYGDNIIRLRIVIELLKRNVKKGLITLSVEDYKEIGYKVLRTDPSLLKSSEDIIVDGVNNWVPSMLLIPLYEDVPTKYRGKIRD